MKQIFSGIVASLTEAGCCAAKSVGYDALVRRAGVYIAVVMVLAVSIAAGWVAADWPYWCHHLQWCAPTFPQ
jgi:hypothetical protein